ncbi:MAG: hypothetical protein FWD72_03750 [Eggerthellaceae bacterium]|nr:hypothetical protein [Eggerthellaceae bacterium]
MFEQDYLMRILVSFAEAIRKSMMKAAGEEDPEGSAELIETAIGIATDLDGGVLLSLAPESIASVLLVSGTDPRVAEYVAQSLLLEARYLREAGNGQRADIREGQAHAIAEAFGFEIGLEELTPEEWDEFFSQDAPTDVEPPQE